MAVPPCDRYAITQRPFFMPLRCMANGTLRPYNNGESNDQPRTIPWNVVAPFLGFAVLVASVWVAATAFGTLPDEVPRALSIFALPPAFYLGAWPFSGTQTHPGRRFFTSSMVRQIRRGDPRDAIREVRLGGVALDSRDGGVVGGLGEP